LARIPACNTHFYLSVVHRAAAISPPRAYRLPFHHAFHIARERRARYRRCDDGGQRDGALPASTACVRRHHPTTAVRALLAWHGLHLRAAAWTRRDRLPCVRYPTTHLLRWRRAGHRRLKQHILSGTHLRFFAQFVLCFIRVWASLTLYPLPYHHARLARAHFSIRLLVLLSSTSVTRARTRV